MTIRRRILSVLALWLAVHVDPVRARADAPAPGSLAELNASWVWLDRVEKQPYNQTIVARKAFELPEAPRSAIVRITADSFYRLSVNGRWINDGPGRSWPEHYEYDVIDVSGELKAGRNEIEVVARYYGVGDFHKVPQAPGLLAQLDVTGANGQALSIGTDATWEVAEAPAWRRNTPKVSIQMEPAELYDARREGDLAFAPARVVAAAQGGPWKGLRPRDVALLTRQPFPLRSFLGAKVVRADGLVFCLPAARLVHPGLIEANNHTSMACGMATILENTTALELPVEEGGFVVTIDGQPPKARAPYRLEPGRHLVLAFVANLFGHDKEKTLAFRRTDGFTLSNPLDPAQANPWVFLRFPEFAVAGSDTPWQPFTNDDPRLAGARAGYNRTRDELKGSIRALDDFRAKLAARAEVLPAETMFVEDPFWNFTHREVAGDAAKLVADPAALMHESPTRTTVAPSPDGDVELLYDLGEQNVGYYSLDLIADAGVTVDVFGVEYIAPDGRVQFPYGNRNGLRYVTKAGANRFVSLKRRSGRYLFVTLRNQKTPVQIRNVHLVESTYPVDLVGEFRSSDERLNRIWDISTRTLRLCMEDTFTDCPLYEQTHWVGDARNESLFAYPTFGATDLALRCIRLTAESLEHLPIAGCQTPSCWDVLIPNWSFLWGISVWDYYWATGDADTLRTYWPAVLRNLEGAEKLVNDRDLFAGPFWNFFDWTPIDSNQKAVLHNSLMCIGAIDAALKIGEAIGDHSKDAWLKALRGRLANGVNRLWDDSKQAYPDAVRDDGSISPSTSQHTSFLAVLFDAIPADRVEAAKRNILNPPEKMVRVGSPFAALYLLSALEKLGEDDAIVAEIYRNYVPMLEAGATTVWESFASGTTGGGGFPTRSHCHAWSSAPNYYLPRIVLGLRATAPASQAVTISPRLSGLTWARGRIATAQGPIAVSWVLDGETVTVTTSAPEGVALKFERNDSLAGKKVVFNGQPVE